MKSKEFKIIQGIQIAIIMSCGLFLTISGWDYLTGTIALIGGLIITYITYIHK